MELIPIPIPIPNQSGIIPESIHILESESYITADSALEVQRL